MTVRFADVVHSMDIAAAVDAERLDRQRCAQETLVGSVPMTIPGQIACGARRANQAGCGDIASVEVLGAQCPR